MYLGDTTVLCYKNTKHILGFCDSLKEMYYVELEGLSWVFSIVTMNVCFCWHVMVACCFCKINLKKP